MSLDLVILGDDGSPKRTVRIGIDCHCALLQKARQFNLPLIGRLHDYYADAVFDPCDMPAFLREIEYLQNASSDERVSSTFLQDVRALCGEAMTEGKAIEALAD